MFYRPDDFLGVRSTHSTNVRDSITSAARPRSLFLMEGLLYCEIVYRLGRGVGRGSMRLKLLFVALKAVLILSTLIVDACGLPLTRVLFTRENAGMHACGHLLYSCLARCNQGDLFWPFWAHAWPWIRTRTDLCLVIRSHRHAPLSGYSPARLEITLPLQLAQETASSEFLGALEYSNNGETHLFDGGRRREFVGDLTGRKETDGCSSSELVDKLRFKLPAAIMRIEHGSRITGLHSVCDQSCDYFTAGGRDLGYQEVSLDVQAPLGVQTAPDVRSHSICTAPHSTPFITSVHMPPQNFSPSHISDIIAAAAQPRLIPTSILLHLLLPFPDHTPKTPSPSCLPNAKTLSTTTTPTPPRPRTKSATRRLRLPPPPATTTTVNTAPPSLILPRSRPVPLRASSAASLKRSGRVTRLFFALSKRRAILRRASW